MKKALLAICLYAANFYCAQPKKIFYGPQLDALNQAIRNHLWYEKKVSDNFELLEDDRAASGHIMQFVGQTRRDHLQEITSAFDRAVKEYTQEIKINSSNENCASHLLHGAMLHHLGHKLEQDNKEFYIQVPDKEQVRNIASAVGSLMQKCPGKPAFQARIAAQLIAQQEYQAVQQSRNPELSYIAVARAEAADALRHRPSIWLQGITRDMHRNQ